MSENASSLHINLYSEPTEAELTTMVQKLQNPLLEKITLSGKVNSLIIALAESLKTNRNIKRVEIEYVSVNQVAMTQLVESVTQSSSVESLKFDACYIPQEGLKTLGPMLKRNISLRELQLDLNHVPAETVRPEIMKCIADGLAENTNLHILKICSAEFGDIGAQYLAAALCVNQTLNELSLDYNGIFNKGGKALASMLEKNTTLQVLAITWNSLSTKAYKRLRKAFRQNKTIRHLNLNSNVSTTKNAAKVIAILGDILGKNTGLEELYFDPDDDYAADEATGKELIDLDNAIAKLLKALSSNQRLKKISLSNYPIAKNSVNAFVEVIRQNNVLLKEVYLNLPENSPKLAPIVQALEKNFYIIKMLHPYRVISEILNKLDTLLSRNKQYLTMYTYIKSEIKKFKEFLSKPLSEEAAQYIHTVIMQLQQQCETLAEIEYSDSEALLEELYHISTDYYQRTNDIEAFIKLYHYFFISNPNPTVTLNFCNMLMNLPEVLSAEGTKDKLTLILLLLMADKSDEAQALVRSTIMHYKIKCLNVLCRIKHRFQP